MNENYGLNKKKIDRPTFGIGRVCFVHMSFFLVCMLLVDLDLKIKDLVLSFVGGPILGVGQSVGHVLV